MRSKIFSSDTIRTTLREQLWISVFLALGFFMAFPVAGMIVTGNWQNLNYSPDQIQKLYEHLWRDGFMITGAAVAAGAGILNGANGFWYLYSPRKVDFYHCLPERRIWMFRNRVLVGMIYYVVPYLVMEFLAVCVGAAQGFFGLKLMGMALTMLGLHFMMYLLFYFSTVLAIVLTGNILTGILVLGGIFAYGPLLCGLIIAYRSCFYGTTCGLLQYGLTDFLKCFLSPVFLGIRLIQNYSGGACGIFPGVMILLTAVFAGLSCLAYCRRPSESNHDSMVYPKVGILLQILVEVPFGLGIGYIFCELSRNNHRILWWIFGMLLGVILAHGMMEVLYYLNPRRFFDGKPQFLLVCILTAFCSVWYLQDLGDFDGFLPAKEQLAGVSMNTGSFGENLDYIVEREDGTYDSVFWEDPESAMNGEKEIGDDSYRILQEIVEYNKSDIAADSQNETIYRVDMKYTMKSGADVYRQYGMTPDQIHELMRAFCEEGELKEQRYSLLNIDEKYIEHITLTTADNIDMNLYEKEPEKKRQLLEALRKDIADAETEDFLGQATCALQFDYRVPAETDLNTMIPSGSEETSMQYLWQQVNLFPSFQRTMKLLEKEGSVDSLEKADISSVEVWLVGKDGLSDSVVYSGKEEVEELKKVMVPDILTSVWLNYEEDVYAVAYRKSGAQMSGSELSSMRLTQLPDFVERDLSASLENQDQSAGED